MILFWIMITANEYHGNDEIFPDLSVVSFANILQSDEMHCWHLRLSFFYRHNKIAWQVR